MFAPLYILLAGVGMLVLIHVPAYRKGRCAIDWVRALAAVVGSGIVVFFSVAALIEHSAGNQAGLNWNSDQRVLWGLLLVVSSGILRFKRTKP